MGRWLARLSISLGALAAVVLAVEIATRIAVDDSPPDNFTPVPRALLEKSALPGLPFTLRPNAQVEHSFGSDPRGYFDPGATLTYRTNALGFRGPETTRRKPPGTLRVVGLGDSFTFGTGVRVEDTYLAGLERRLDDAGGRRTEVLNLGVVAYDTSNEIALLEALGLGLEPDLVVIGFFLNDAGSNVPIASFFAPPDEARPWWRRWLRSVDWLARRRAERRASLGVVEAYRASLRDDAPGWIEVRSALARGKALAERHGFDLALAIFPVLFALSDYPLADEHRRVAELARGLGIPAVDLAPAFAGHDGPELWVHPSNRHPNEVAHDIAAEALHRFLVEEGLVDG